jgi:3' terminal RNA ribose 2'-O-methyltransferase Hen1
VLLTITTTLEPATDLGYLLHKHPDRPQSFSVAHGTAHVFYPEAAATRCTAALLLEVDAIGLVRGPGAELTQYVNDRPYAASSMLAVALKEVFRTALTGRCDARPELAATAIPLEIHVTAVRCEAGAALVHRLFEPLGWTVAARPEPLDPPEWGDSPYLDVRLTGVMKLADALNHLYVLLPVLDDAKHYWVSTDEVDKLIRAGGEWLGTHPEKALISGRYLAHRRSLTRSALTRLAEADDADPASLDNAVPDAGEEPREPLAVQRREAVLAVLRETGARRVGDLGCGSGMLTGALLAEGTIEHVVAADVSVRALRMAARRLDQMPRKRLEIFQTSLTYRDDRLAGLDAAVLMEVIEHVEPDRLPALERVVFGYAAPGMVIVTTPNAEYNVRYEGLDAGAMRHADHRFEWSRAQFRAWAESVAGEYGYKVRFLGAGEDSDAGMPTQMGVFEHVA